MEYPNKILMNSPDLIVEDSHKGIKAAFPGLSISESSRIVMYCQSSDRDRVGIVSGGGAGHEPFCAGYVGRGMLNAAVAGSVFTSPPATDCLTAIQNVGEHHRGGILVLIPSYTGDILNFGEAIEIARDQGYKVQSLVVGEDCALDIHNNEKLPIGKRGLCGQLFIYKIAGALANNYCDLTTILGTSRKVLSNMASLGICTSPCTLPGASRPLFQLSPDQMELGVGVHGEAGVSKIKVCSAREIVEIILTKIISTLNLRSGDEVCVIVNNLGSSTQIESFVIVDQVKTQLCKAGMVVHRIYTSTLLTSLDMGGVQICLLRITDNNDWLPLLDADTDAFAWPGRATSVQESHIQVVKKTDFNNELIGPELNPDESLLFKLCLEAIAVDFKSNEEKLNPLDSGCGDGDCGTTLRRFADGILASLADLPTHRPASCILRLAEIASQTMGGTSGGIYRLLLRGAARSVPDWASAFKGAIETVQMYSAAKRGSRTLLDALIPACEEFQLQLQTDTWLKALEFAVEQAEAGCKSTRYMEAKCGRASYVNKSYLTDVDAGAYGATVCLRAIYKQICKHKANISPPNCITA